MVASLGCVSHMSWKNSMVVRLEAAFFGKGCNM